MSAATLVAFNLLLNGVLAFALALLLSRAAIRFLRIPPGRTLVALSALPFAKLAFDLARGVPDDAFLWQRVEGMPRDLGSFSAGLGLKWCFLRVHLALGALSGSGRYPDSAPDLLSALLGRKVGAWAPLVIVTVLLAVALVLLVGRAREWARAARLATKVRADGQLVESCAVGRRRVPVYIAAVDAGSPFSGGILRPYVCFPRALWSSLSSEERAATIAHELGHVAHLHLVIALISGLIEDLFWFVPGVAWARRRLREALELDADAWAIRRGHAPLQLASALVRIGQSTADHAFDRSTCGVARGAVASRLARLLGESSGTPRLGCDRPWIRALATAWVAGSVLAAITFGNQ